MNPSEINIKFFMYTCKNKYRPYEIKWDADDEYVKKSPFIKEKRTVFIIHGYLDLYEEMNWMGDLKDFILDDQRDEKGPNCGHNVIAVDWHNGSQVTLYPKAVANTQMVGAVVAGHIRQLIRVYDNLTPNDFTVVGHSLGAQTSGFVGKHFQGEGGKLRNIIGLDPAGPSFSDINDTHRLNPNDAKLVLTIHTNGGQEMGDNFGLLTPLGHYSFYPNGGHQQTGCEKTKAVANILLNGVVGGLTDTMACSHRRATRLVAFNESHLTYAQAVAFACASYEEYAAGNCGTCSDAEQCKPFSNWFGWWQEQEPPSTWTKPVKYYLDTTSTIPWTMFAIQVIVETGNIAVPVNGSLEITPFGRFRNGPKILITDRNELGKIKANTKYSYLMKVPKDLGQVRQAIVNWIDGEEGAKISLKSITFNFLSHINSKEREKQSAVLYYKKDFISGQKVLFQVESIKNLPSDLNDKLEQVQLSRMASAELKN